MEEDRDWKEYALQLEKKVQELENRIKELTLDKEKAPDSSRKEFKFSNWGFERTLFDRKKINEMVNLKRSEQEDNDSSFSINSTLREIEKIKKSHEFAGLAKIETDKLVPWLQEKNLNNFLLVYTDDKAAEKRGDREALMYDVDPTTNMIILQKSSLSSLLQLITTPTDSSLHYIFDYFTFLKEFLLTYRTYTSRSELFSALYRSFFSENATASLKQSIIVIIRQWIELGYGEDFASKSFSEKFREFCDRLQRDEKFGSLYKELLTYPSKVARFKPQMKQTNPPESLLEPERGLLTSSSSKKIFEFSTESITKDIVDSWSPHEKLDNLLDFHPLEVARQITLMFEKKLSVIKYRECLKQAWTKKNKEVAAPNLVNMLDFVNHLSGWVIFEILKLPLSDLRTNTIRLFIEVARRLRELNNFFGLFTIIATLHNSSIQKLKSSWKALDRQSKQTFEDLTFLISNESKYKNYYRALNSIPLTDPAIPIISITLGDIAKLNEVVDDEVDDPAGWINWNKMRTLAKLVWEFKPQIIRPPYCLYPVKAIQNFIERSEAWNQDKITYKIAELRENQDSWTYEPPQPSYSRILQDESIWELTERDWNLLLTVAGKLRTYKRGDHVIIAGSNYVNLYRLESGSVGFFKLRKRRKSTVAIKEGVEIVTSLTSFKTSNFGLARTGSKRKRREYKMGAYRESVSEGTDNDLAKPESVLDNLGAIFGYASVYAGKDEKAELNVRVLSEEAKIWEIDLDLVIQSFKENPTLRLKFNASLSSSISRIEAQTESEIGKTIAAQYKDEDLTSSGGGNGGKKEDNLSPPTTATSTPLTKRNQEAKNNDAILRSKFDLPPGQVLLKGYKDVKLVDGLSSYVGDFYVLNAFFCYSGRSFGFKKSIKLQIDQITSFQLTSKNLIKATLKSESESYMFSGFSDISSTFEFLKSLWRQYEFSDNHTNLTKSTSTPAGSSSISVLSPLSISAKSSLSSSGSNSLSEDSPKNFSDCYILDEKDWSLILAACVTVNFKAGTSIVSEGVKMGLKLFQIQSGSCNIQKNVNKTPTVIATLGTKDSFGEIEFFNDSVPQVSLVAVEDTTINIIEGYYLNVLFQHHPYLRSK
eukprot:TRINITY_DN3439_c0_g1_i2.p1 TRINITY_DN3439_c0_g1~~TRINITY_DN3439_c0_g1_i2.p1  ORF type:complete len:1102 (+),score=270.77 TRINITY_DN3439_c0_g1_i2:21-3326(+)